MEEITMTKIFCLLGKSGSGKSYIYNSILKDHKNLKLKPVIAYTTRPKRTGEVNGKDYFYLSNEEFKFKASSGEFATISEYDTVNGKWCYGTQKKFDDNENYLAITTPSQYFDLQKNTDSKLYPFYIHLSDELRKERLKLREAALEKPNYEEIERRMKTDDVDFSEDVLSKIPDLIKVSNEGYYRVAVNEINNLIYEKIQED